jgi:hypothetical protein
MDGFVDAIPAMGIAGSGVTTTEAAPAFHWVSFSEAVTYDDNGEQTAMKMAINRECSCAAQRRAMVWIP